MSKLNPVYPPVIQYLNKLSVGTIFQIEEISKCLPELNLKYLKNVVNNLSMKNFYIEKLFDEELIKSNKKKIIGYIKHRNIPTDKTYTDICWFLKYDL